MTLTKIGQHRLSARNHIAYSIYSEVVKLDFRPLGVIFELEKFVFGVYLAGGSAPLTPLWRLWCASHRRKGVLDPVRSCTAAWQRHSTPGKLSLTDVAAARPRPGAKNNCC